MPDISIHDIDRRVTTLEVIVADLKETQQKQQATAEAIEKHVAEQKITNKFLADMLVEFKNGYATCSQKQDDRYIELIKKDSSQDIESVKSKQDSFKDFIFDWGKKLLGYALMGGLVYYLLTKGL